MAGQRHPRCGDGRVDETRCNDGSCGGASQSTSNSAASTTRLYKTTLPHDSTTRLDHTTLPHDKPPRRPETTATKIGRTVAQRCDAAAINETARQFQGNVQRGIGAGQKQAWRILGNAATHTAPKCLSIWAPTSDAYDKDKTTRGSGTKWISCATNTQHALRPCRSRS